MGIQRVGLVERVLTRLFVPLFIGAGIIVAGGFFFPEIVGDSISGEWWLVIALLFFGSGLGYLAVLPTEHDTLAEHEDVNYLMRVQRIGLRQNIERFRSRIDPLAFGVPVGALVIFFLLQWIAEPQLFSAVSAIQSVLTRQLGWIFAGVMLISLIFCVFLVFSAWGDIKLGGEDASPTYSLPVYFTMFFTAGIAAGIVFSGLSEPITHYGDPPPLFDTEPRSDQAITASLTYALFHWGFTAWSAYVVIGLPIAYYVYERGAPLRVSALLTPFLGRDNLTSPIGRTVDILAIFATIGGIATSVALVSRQFLAGIEYQWEVSAAVLGPIVFVSGLTGIYVLSAQSGVHRGIRRIAGVNIGLFAVMAVLIVAVGPRGSMVEFGARAGSGYATEFVPMSLQFGYDWVAGWTLWNWAWWFSWAPFAGLFLAALSRGRRIRTVVLTAVGATGLATIVWFLIIGGTTLHVEHRADGGILDTVQTHPDGNAVAAFPLLDALALSDLLMFLFLGLIIVFMTTSADTSTLVVAILASKQRIAPTTATIVFWGVLQGAVAIIVLVTGTETLLQATAVLVGGPFAVIAVVAMIGLVIGLRDHDGDHQSPLVGLWNKIPKQPDFSEERP